VVGGTGSELRRSLRQSRSLGLTLSGTGLGMMLALYSRNLSPPLCGLGTILTIPACSQKHRRVFLATQVNVRHYFGINGPRAYLFFTR
jgi:hypothetical protein